MAYCLWHPLAASISRMRAAVDFMKFLSMQSSFGEGKRSQTSINIKIEVESSSLAEAVVGGQKEKAFHSDFRLIRNIDLAL